MTDLNGMEHPGAVAGPAGPWKFDRRQVLRLSALAVAIPGTMAASGPAKAMVQPEPVLLAVSDRRSSASRAFAQAIAPHAAAVHDVAEGMTRLWQNALVPHWQVAGSLVCGVTSPGVWNGLREQARSAGRRAYRLAVHDDPNDIADFKALSRQLVAAAHARSAPQATSQAGMASAAPGIERLPALVSWIIR